MTYKPVQLHCGHRHQKGGVKGPHEDDKIRQLRALTPQINTSCWSWPLDKHKQCSSSSSSETETKDLQGEKRMFLLIPHCQSYQRRKGEGRKHCLRDLSLKLTVKIIQFMGHPFSGQDWINYSAYSNSYYPCMFIPAPIWQSVTWFQKLITPISETEIIKPLGAGLGMSSWGWAGGCNLFLWLWHNPLTTSWTLAVWQVYTEFRGKYFSLSSTDTGINVLFIQ